MLLVQTVPSMPKMAAEERCDHCRRNCDCKLVGNVRFEVDLRIKLKNGRAVLLSASNICFHQSPQMMSRGEEKVMVG